MNIIPNLDLDFYFDSSSTLRPLSKDNQDKSFPIRLVVTIGLLIYMISITNSDNTHPYMPKYMRLILFTLQKPAGINASFYSFMMKIYIAPILGYFSGSLPTQALLKRYFLIEHKKSHWVLDKKEYSFTRDRGQPLRRCNSAYTSVRPKGRPPVMHVPLRKTDRAMTR